MLRIILIILLAVMLLLHSPLSSALANSSGQAQANSPAQANNSAQANSTAQANTDEPTTTTSTLTTAPTSAQINSFIAEFVAENQQQVPGGVISWVQGPHPAVTSAFGVADIDRGIAVDATTQFRIASVSKIFTAIAVAKLVEQGQLDLTLPIDRYLAPDITSQLTWPVTTIQLLTHTAGFEQQFFADSSESQAQQQSLREHLQQALPKQIYRPGSVIAYSNYGNALAALVVEAISQQPFHQYVQQQILQPLNMLHTGYQLPEQQRQRLAIGYQQYRGQYQAQPYTFVHRYPATSMITTAADMQQLIHALVMPNNVITPGMQQLLFSRQFSHHPRLPAMGLAFMEYQRQGLQAWWHDGSHAGFNAELVIIPKLNAGFFSAVNSGSGALPANFRRKLVNELLTRPSTIDVTAITHPDLSQYAGYYRNTRRNQTRFEALQTLFSNDIHIQANADELVMGGNHYYPVAEQVFQEKSAGHLLVFGQSASASGSDSARDSGQPISTLMLDWGGAPRALLKLQWWQASSVQLLILATLVLAALIVIILLLRNPKKAITVWLRLALALPLLIMLMFVLLLIAYFFTLDPLQIRFGHLGSLQLIMLLPLAALVWQGLVFIRWYRVSQLAYHVASVIILSSLLVFFWQYHVVGW